MQLHDKTVIITGGARGIGVTYAHAFADEGAHVVIADILGTDGAEVTRELSTQGGQAIFIQTDVADEVSAQAMADHTVATFGKIDILVNNAAIYLDIGRKKPFNEITSEEWDRIMAVNVRGMWQCIKAVYPYMKQQQYGKIVNIASSVAFSGAAGFAHYVASKAAVVGLTRAIAREVGDDHITVNAVAPGLVANVASQQLNSGEYMEQAPRTRAIKQPLRPDDLVGAVLLFASPASDFITGETLIVDGGVVMH